MSKNTNYSSPSSPRQPNHKTDEPLPKKKKGYLEKRDKGAFVLSILGGHLKKRFADAFYFSQAYAALASRKFKSNLELVTFVRSLPNGYTTFRDMDDGEQGFTKVFNPGK